VLRRLQHLPKRILKNSLPDFEFFFLRNRKLITIKADIRPGGLIRKKSSIKKIKAMRKLEVYSGLLVTIAAKNTKRTFGPDQFCGVVCKGKI